MAKYDTYPNPDGTGLLLDIQSDLLEGLNTRVVVPLLPMTKAPIPAKRLNPIFHINNVDYVMITQFLSAVPRSILKNQIRNIDDKSDEVTIAVDMLTQGV